MLAAPCALTIANLIAAMAVRPVFRAHAALLVFHVCLVVIVAAMFAGRLLYFRGQAEVSQGEQFEGRLISHESGPFNDGLVRTLRFVNEGFDIDYTAGRRRADTRNPVRWVDETGRSQRAVIGDDTPLVLRGYRFYTTPNKGFRTAPSLERHRAGAGDGHCSSAALSGLREQPGRAVAPARTGARTDARTADRRAADRSARAQSFPTAPHNRGCAAHRSANPDRARPRPGSGAARGQRPVRRSVHLDGLCDRS